MKTTKIKDKTTHELLLALGGENIPNRGKLASYKFPEPFNRTLYFDTNAKFKKLLEFLDYIYEEGFCTGYDAGADHERIQNFNSTDKQRVCLP